MTLRWVSERITGRAALRIAGREILDYDCMAGLLTAWSWWHWLVLLRIGYIALLAAFEHMRKVSAIFLSS